MKTRWQKIRSQMPTTIAGLIDSVGIDKARSQLETQWRTALKIVNARESKADEEMAEIYRKYPDFDTEDGKRRY